MSGLTPVQLKVMRFIEDYFDRHGFAPTFQEIADSMGFVSKSSAYRVIDCLIARQYVRRSSGARAMEIVRRVGDATPAQHIVYETTLQMIARGLSPDPAKDAQRVLDAYGAPAQASNEA